MKSPMAVKAGQVYRAKARRGYRYARVEQVRRPEDNPYAILLEVSEDGAPLTGRDGYGLPRSEPFVSHLTWRDRAWHLAARYEEAA